MKGSTKGKRGYGCGKQSCVGDSETAKEVREDHLLISKVHYLHTSSRPGVKNEKEMHDVVNCFTACVVNSCPRAVVVR